jgi:hypothetical protein
LRASFGLVVRPYVVEFIEFFDDPFPVGQRQEHRLTMLLLVNNKLWMNRNHRVISIANGKTLRSWPTISIVPGEMPAVNPDQRMGGGLTFHRDASRSGEWHIDSWCGPFTESMKHWQSQWHTSTVSPSPCPRNL